MIELIERYQSELDKGYSINKTAKMLGIHHQVLIRLIKSKKLEVYKVIEDLTRDVPQEVINFEWLWYEDRLDEIARDSLHHNFYISENFKSKDDVLLSRYCVSSYGGLHNYLNKKHHNVLCQSIYKTCTKCSKNKNIGEFSPCKHGYLGIYFHCKSCESKRRNSYVKDNYVKVKVLVTKKRYANTGLPNTLSEKEYLVAFKHFNNKCCKCGTSKEISLDHYIPRNWGHGGNTIENIIPLCRSCNSYKSTKNPLKISELDHVIPYLASLNNLSEQEFKSYVNWCSDNKRPIHDIKSKVPSIEAWKESLN
ncbi:HNH endonuclease [Alkalihalobacillus pseudalcaliphilus]|uniref:HNH endonuclease n=1 Tax=Alkalihalobacillus pseudalcaliphilus TaxID=79884 RepID=UPI00064D791D|nr:HNH endonuclease [Alkalihalobacillus pseudalcaliphilus]KMK75399.1 hypothetical protein AB990_08750 [Alkalihalobacillus pseudalcaliphilus]